VDKRVEEREEEKSLVECSRGWWFDWRHGFLETKVLKRDH